MELSEVLDERIVSIDLDAENKKDALMKMSLMLQQEHYIKDVEEFVADIYIREAEGITGIGNGVAIPHGKSDSVQRIGIAIAKLLHPIAWESLDGESVDLIFLFCVSSDANFAQNHMRMLSRVAGKIADDDLLQAIKNSKSCEAVIRLMGGDCV